MTIPSNVHTHSTFCDGKNTPEEMVQAALALGFTGLGFSSHAPAPYDPTCPGVADEAAYTAHIRTLAARYEGQIDIACGIEQDAMAPVDAGAYDYVIGSAHYLRPPGSEGPLSIDMDPQHLARLVQNWYGGDALAMVRDYYAVLAASVAQTRPTIVGHFDLVTKFNRHTPLFDEESAAYQSIALEALDAVLDAIGSYGGMLEVNTGAMARGWRDAPYPAPFLLRHAAQRGARVILSSDSHSAQTLDFAFPAALRAICGAGFTRLAVYGNKAFTDRSIED
uniref:histidinol-phosphatase n=1 Tax=termite gut metagenome TaxID=433724 RepID=S0DDV2_9ZZZZ